MSSQALAAVLQETYIHGVSTRSASEIVKADRWIVREAAALQIASGASRSTGGKA